MKTHTIAFVMFIAAALAVAAILVTSRGGATPVSVAGTGDRLLPKLAARINDAAEVRVHRARTGEGAQQFTFRRDEPRGWTLVEKHGYPVKGENLRALLIGLTELKAVEAKTSKPELYSRIGVQDPDGAAVAEAGADGEPRTQPTLVTVLDASGAEIDAVIIGTVKWGGTPEVYARRKSEGQAWLAAGRVDVPFDELAWVERTVVSVPRERWKTVTVTHADGESVRVVKADAMQANFFAEGTPEGRELTSVAAGDSLGNVFSSITLDDVRPVSSFVEEAIKSATRTVGETFDGLVITARTFESDGKQWATFEAAAGATVEGSAAAKQAEELNQRLSGWAFAVPSFRSKALLTRWSDLLNAVEQPVVASPDPGVEAPIDVLKADEPPDAEVP